MDHTDSSHILNCSLLPCWPWASLHLELVWCHCGISLSVHQRGGMCHPAERRVDPVLLQHVSFLSPPPKRFSVTYKHDNTFSGTAQLLATSSSARFPLPLQTSNETIESSEILILLPQPGKDSHSYTFLHCSGLVQTYFSLALNCNRYTFLKRKFCGREEEEEDVSVSLLSWCTMFAMMLDVLRHTGAELSTISRGGWKHWTWQ